MPLKDQSMPSLSNIVDPMDLEDAQPGERTPEGLVIEAAMDKVGKGGTVTEQLLLSTWCELHGAEPTEEQRRELLTYARLIGRIVASVRGER